jgi:hypothetical protein
MTQELNQHHKNTHVTNDTRMTTLNNTHPTLDTITQGQQQELNIKSTSTHTKQQPHKQTTQQQELNTITRENLLKHSTMYDIISTCNSTHTQRAQLTRSYNL